MPGRHPHRYHRCFGHRGTPLGIDPGKAPAPALCLVLALKQQDDFLFMQSFPKIFSNNHGFFQKSICICEKKGYNILE
jgi:hypothetical protein